MKITILIGKFNPIFICSYINKSVNVVIIYKILFIFIKLSICRVINFI